MAENNIRMFSKEYQFDIVKAGGEYIGFKDDKLYFLPSFIDAKIGEYTSKGEIKDLLNYIDYFSREIKYIAYFYKEGDVSYTTSVYGSGGSFKGGGSSLGGAIVGGLIGGNTGAIIGSRKKTEYEPGEIRTIENKHDTRVTVLTYINGDTQRFGGFELYDFLLSKIPDKDLLFVQMVKQKSQNQKKESVEKKPSIDDIELVKKYKELLDMGIINQDEFEKKKKELLDL